MCIDGSWDEVSTGGRVVIVARGEALIDSIRALSNPQRLAAKLPS